MGLFGFGKKKENEKETEQGCCCGGACTPEAVEKAAPDYDAEKIYESLDK